MLPELLIRPVPHEPPVNLPEYSRDGAGTVFNDLIQNVIKTSQDIELEDKISEETEGVTVGDTGLEVNAEGLEAGLVASATLDSVTESPSLAGEEGVAEPDPKFLQVGSAANTPLIDQLPGGLNPATADRSYGNPLPSVDTVDARALDIRLDPTAATTVAAQSSEVVQAPALASDAPLGTGPGPLPVTGTGPAAATVQTAAATGERAPAVTTSSIGSDRPAPELSLPGTDLSQKPEAQARNQVAQPAGNSSALNPAGVERVSRPEHSPAPIMPAAVDSEKASPDPSRQILVGPASSLMNSPPGRHSEALASLEAVTGHSSIASRERPSAEVSTRDMAGLPVAQLTSKSETPLADARLIPRSTLADRLQQMNSVTSGSAATGLATAPGVAGEGGAQTAAGSVAQVPFAGVPVSSRVDGYQGMNARTASLTERRSNSSGSDSTVASTTFTEAQRLETALQRSEQLGQSHQIPAQLARQIVQSHSQNLSELRMLLKPEDLGQLDLKLRIDGERVHVAIVTQQPGVRELLEAQLPQLRSLLQEGGFQLGDVDVRHQGDQARDQPPEQTLDSRSIRGEVAEETRSTLDGERRPRSDGLIDAFV